jgi:hypothetical protein
MNLSEDYADFSKAWRTSWSFRIFAITVPTLSIGLTVGGLAGMFYTVYKDLFTGLFTLGILLSGFLTVIVGGLCIGFCLRKRR